MTDCNGEEVCRELADAGAALGGHFAQTRVHDCGSADLDLLALPLMRLGHADDRPPEKALYLVPTRRSGLDFRPSSPRYDCRRDKAVNARHCANTFHLKVLSDLGVGGVRRVILSVLANTLL